MFRLQSDKRWISIHYIISGIFSLKIKCINISFVNANILIPYRFTKFSTHFFENVHISVTVAQAEIVVHDNMTIAGFIVRG
ncbi:MAG: hypothetical protein BHV69_03115 [Bacteroidales bacterium 52_46]|nr:MAG: hypothetical protein BHV69_03115 [Bacteroidales bacterium 52_46]